MFRPRPLTAIALAATTALLLAACSPSGLKNPGATPAPGAGGQSGAGPSGQAPVIKAVSSEPELKTDGNFKVLPPGAGKLVIRLEADNTERVRFLLTPTGTDTAPLTKTLGEDTDGKDGWSFTWSYPNEGIMAHLTVEAEGPGGKTSTMFGIYHEVAGGAPGQGAVVRSGTTVFQPNAGVLVNPLTAAREVTGLPKYTRVLGWLDGQTVLALAGSNPIAFDAATGAYRALNRETWWAVPSPDGSLLAYRDQGGVHVVRTGKDVWGKEVAKLPTGGEGRPASIELAFWSPDGERLLTVSEGEEAGPSHWVFDLASLRYQLLQTNEPGYYGASAVGWLDNNRIAFTQRASRSRTGASEYREAGYRADLAVYNVDGGSYRRISDVPDGVFLEGRQVAGGMILAHRYEKEASRFQWELWDAASAKGQVIAIPDGSPVTAVSRDGQRLLYLTPGKNEEANHVGTVGVYDIPDKVSYDLGTLRHSDHWSAAFSPDGSRLAMSASLMIDGQQPYVAWTLDLKMR